MRLKSEAEIDLISILSDPLRFVPRLCMERRGEASLASDRGRGLPQVYVYRARYRWAIGLSIYRANGATMNSLSLKCQIMLVEYGDITARKRM